MLYKCLTRRPEYVASNQIGLLRRHPLGLAAFTAFAILGTLSIYFGGQAAWADAATVRGRFEMDRGKGFLPPVAWLQARNDFQAGLRLNPDNSELNERLGLLYASRGFATAQIAELSKANYLRALEYYRRAAAGRPMSPFTWANIALVLHRLGQEPAAMWSAFDRAMDYGPNEPGVQAILADIGYAHHVELAPLRRKALQRAFHAALGPLRISLEGIGRRYDVDPSAL